MRKFQSERHVVVNGLIVQSVMLIRKITNQIVQLKWCLLVKNAKKYSVSKQKSMRKQMNSALVVITIMLLRQGQLKILVNWYLNSNKKRVMRTNCLSTKEKNSVSVYYSRKSGRTVSLMTISRCLLKPIKNVDTKIQFIIFK